MKRTPSYLKSKKEISQRTLEDRLSEPDLAARTENDHFPVGILCAEDQQLGGESRDVIGTKVADADEERARPAPPVRSSRYARCADRVVVPALGAEETRRAVNAAEEALPAWLPTGQRARSPAWGVVPVDARERRRPFPDHDCRDLEPRERWLGNLPRSMLPKWQRSRSTTLRPLIRVCVPILGAGNYGDMANRWECRLALADIRVGCSDWDRF